MSSIAPEEITDVIFQREVRITQILPLVGLFHFESMSPWEDALDMRHNDLGAILKNRLDLDMDKYEDAETLARAIALKDDRGYIVFYEFPRIEKIHDDEGNSRSVGGFSTHCYYLEKVDDAGLVAILEDAEKYCQARVAELREERSRRVATGKK